MQLSFEFTNLTTDFVRYIIIGLDTSNNPAFEVDTDFLNVEEIGLVWYIDVADHLIYQSKSFHIECHELEAAGPSKVFVDGQEIAGFYTPPDEYNTPRYTMDVANPFYRELPDTSPLVLTGVIATVAVVILVTAVFA